MAMVGQSERAHAPINVSPATSDPLAARVRDWISSRGWTPFPFQELAWRHHAAGRSGLIHVPTGAGKTYAAYLGALSECLEDPGEKPGERIRILYISPLRAVSRDIAKAMTAPVDDLGAARLVTVETRTGDTSRAVRKKQEDRLPTVLVTTPESLTLQLTRDDAAERFASLSTVIVDEWHELLSTKRGSQTELALARLRRVAPRARTWALSATLDNLEDAARAAVGTDVEPAIVGGRIDRPVIVESVLPNPGDPFPWAGHLGLRMLERVTESIEVGDDGLPRQSTLVFTNTRSQAERWFHAIEFARPAWRAHIALHHGSIDRDRREQVEAGLKDGSIRLVVATSSLDLGVDFAPVERVMQIGSPKGIARLMQRAGRASHRPGAACRIVCVPTHAMEMVEIAAVRRAIDSGQIEPRTGEDKPLDVLSQHMVTRALGGGFTPDDLFDEVRSAWSYRDLSRDEFDWTLDLVTRGGETLKAYEEYKRVVVGADGVARVPERKVASLHRLNVGTIAGDSTLDIRFANGRRLGSIEENFVAKLKPGEKFVFAGRVVSFVRISELTAIVRPATGTTRHTPIWSGTRLPITESLGSAVRETLQLARQGDAESPELKAASELIETQSRLSLVPDADQTLAEIVRTREGHHLFVYPFEGRLVHGGLAALIALRLSRLREATFSLAANDYGFEMLCTDEFPFEDLLTPELLSLDELDRDAMESVNLSALARSQFREIARVAGLVFQSYPGAQRRVRHLQAKAGLIFDVFEQFDPGNLLLHQARREVLAKQFERSRLGRTLARLARDGVVVRNTDRPTPLAFPLIIERVGGRISSESLAKRVEKMQNAWRRR